jgi:hypothetical protein
MKTDNDLNFSVCGELLYHLYPASSRLHKANERKAEKHILLILILSV